MRKLQQISNILFITFILLISINLLLGWSWEVRTKIKFKNFEPFDEVVREALNLDKKIFNSLYRDLHRKKL